MLPGALCGATAKRGVLAMALCPTQVRWSWLLRRVVYHRPVMAEPQLMQASRLPWWTWLLPLPLFHLGTWLSLGFGIGLGSSLWYMPIPLGLALVHWWGPRVLLGLWLNALLCAGLWGLDELCGQELTWAAKLWRYPLYALPETIAVGLSWLLAGRLLHCRVWMPDAAELLRFGLLGLALPITLGGLLTQGQFVALDVLPSAQFSQAFQLGWIADLLGGLAVTVPLLMAASHALERRGWSLTHGAQPLPGNGAITTQHVMEFGALALTIWLLTRQDGTNGILLAGLAGLWAALRFRMPGAFGFTIGMVVLTLLIPGAVGSIDKATMPQTHLALSVLLLEVLVVARAVQTATDRLDERGRAEAQVRAEQEHLRITLESIGDAVIATDHLGRVARMNPVAEQLTGWRTTEAAGRHLDEVFVIRNARTRRPVPSPVARVLGSGTVVGLANHTVLIGRDGTETHIADSGAPIRGAGGAVVGVVLVFRDVGDEERAREQALQQQKLEALGQLAGGVAHDFNNLLAAIIAAAELLGRRLDPTGPDARYLGIIANAGSRGADLARQLLAFARKAPLRDEPVDLNRIVQDTAALLERLIEKRIVVQVEQDPARPMTQGDAGQLQSVLLNLGINARDAIAGTGRILLTTAIVKINSEESAVLGVTPGVYARITVVDDGCGIALDVLPRIFDPFFTTKPSGQGTGLGLAAVFGVVRAHRGAVGVVSAPGKGSCFTLHLPHADALPVGLAASVAELRPCSVLLIDDDEAVRGAWGALLTAAGCSVEAHDGGDGALSRLGREPLPDLVLLDLDMPGAGGGALCQAIRLRHPGLAVLMISGHAPGAILGSLLDQPRTGFLAKPFGRDQLALAVRRIAPELTG